MNGYLVYTDDPESGMWGPLQLCESAARALDLARSLIDPSARAGPDVVIVAFVNGLPGEPEVVGRAPGTMMLTRARWERLPPAKQEDHDAGPLAKQAGRGRS
jgi:hypothetical protein